MCGGRGDGDWRKSAKHTYTHTHHTGAQGEITHYFMISFSVKSVVFPLWHIKWALKPWICGFLHMHLCVWAQYFINSKTLWKLFSPSAMVTVGMVRWADPDGGHWKCGLQSALGLWWRGCWFGREMGNGKDRRKSGSVGKLRALPATSSERASLCQCQWQTTTHWD